MEKFREAVKRLEANAETFDRLIGSGARKQPSDERVAELVAMVDEVSDALLLPAPEAGMSVRPAAPGPRRSAAAGRPAPSDKP